jgi:hypothetical protein
MANSDHHDAQAEDGCTTDGGDEDEVAITVSHDVNNN